MVTRPEPTRRRSLPRLSGAAEAVSVLAAPAVLFFLLRLQGMAPVQIPDPGIETGILIDPRDVFTRYSAAFNPSARLREAAEVGFLVPARASYLMFGAVGGFFAFRYVLALIAIVPLYVLLKRLYGRWAGLVGIAVVMSSPVLVTAWGTDYTDSSAVSYLLGGISALAMPSSPRRRPLWLIAAGGLLTLAIWSHGAAVPLAGATLVAYTVIRLLRARVHFFRDASVLVVAAVLVTAVLAVCSKVELGQFNFITPTLQAERFLSRPNQERLWHSRSWRWILYDPYLLVPPAVFLSYAAVFFARRWRSIGTPQAFVGLVGLLSILVDAYYQFLGNVQVIEMPFLSSMLWSSVTVLSAFTVSEMAAPFVGAVGANGNELPDVHRAGAPVIVAGAARRALPVVVVIAVALAYETDPHVPAMKLSPWGWELAAIVVGVAVLWRLGGRIFAGKDSEDFAGPRSVRIAFPFAAIVLFLGASLILTVAPEVSHAQMPRTVDDPPTVYASALGGNDSSYVDQYQVVSEIEHWVGNATYPGEQLLMWWPWSELEQILEPFGIYHANFDSVHGTFPVLSASGAKAINIRHPAEILVMSVTSDGGFAEAVRSLEPYRPVVVRRGVLSDGSFHLHLWLVDLLRYIRPAAN